MRRIAINYNGNRHTIWRIRANDLRILFFYGDDRVILLLDAFAKRRDNVKIAQKKAAEDVIRRYLDGKPIAMIKDEGNETPKG